MLTIYNSSATAVVNQRKKLLRKT